MANLLSLAPADATITAAATSTPLTVREALSGVFGSISLAAWIFLLVPQLVQNYTLRSAEGISLAFLTVWFIGDITNLAGSVWAGLVPTVTALAAYFCVADLVLITQCLYYNFINARKANAEHASQQHDGQQPQRRKGSAHSANGGADIVNNDDDYDEEQPLLTRQNSDSFGLPGSQRRRSSATSRRRRESGPIRDSALAQIVEEGTGRGAWVKNTASIAVICLAGAAGWAIAWKTGVWTPAPMDDDADGSVDMAVGAQVLGYLSALCYLGARIPQIVKNQRERSCEGLSLLFFLLSLLGNFTYGAGILFHSTEHDYVVKNVPWLLGSLGTMLEDAVIFVQFHVFGNSGPSSAIV